jgi:anti-sigma-K factor RskA
MDIKAYIESGILESYALGICTEQEQHEVEKLCAQYPEIKIELEQVQQAINDYSTLYSKNPQPIIKQHIFDEIDQLEQKNKPKIETKIIALNNNNNPYKFAIAASLILFALSFIGNIIIYNKYKSANDEVIALNQEKNQLADNFKTNQVKLEIMNKDMAVIANPMVQKVMMKGVAKSPESMAMIYWNTQSKEVFIEIKKLPMPDAGKQYQLWAIVDGKPVDAGMITMTEGDSSLHKMKDFNTAQAFAITLEKEGGSPTPTLTEMYVMGAVSL